jgi:beta-phosphoglucomutase-like phosphatase (HAD superfamily)
MRAIQSIAFDLEGPLVDFERHHFKAHTDAAEQLLGQIVSYEWIISNIPHAIGGGDLVIATGIARHYGNDEDIASLLRLKGNLFASLISQQGISARPGAVEAVRWFIENGYHVTIGSNTPTDEAFKYLDQSTLTQLIKRDNVVLVEHVNGKKKPLPDIYLETAKRIGIDPRHQLVIDDSPAGLEAASAAGSWSIATPLHRTQASMADIVRWNPRRIIHNWGEVHLESMMKSLEEEVISQP